MTDAAQAALWLGVLCLGWVFCIAIRRLGVPTTHVRDVLHVGAGVWPLGWPFWHSAIAPTCIASGAVLGLLCVPVLASRSPALAKLQLSVSDQDERWSGLVFYAASFAVLTWVGMRGGFFPAATALLALALGDGIGGAVGRRFGRHFFAAPGGKRKSLEGSLAVAAFSSAGALIAAHLFGAQIGPASWLLIGMTAAIAEAASPRAADNVVVPGLVWWVAARIT